MPQNIGFVQYFVALMQQLITISPVLEMAFEKFFHGQM